MVRLSQICFYAEKNVNVVIIKISLRSTHVSSQFLKSMMQKCTSDRLVSLSYEQLDFNNTKPSAHECLSETLSLIVQSDAQR